MSKAKRTGIMLGNRLGGKRWSNRPSVLICVLFIGRDQMSIRAIEGKKMNNF